MALSFALLSGWVRWRLDSADSLAATTQEAIGRPAVRDRLASALVDDLVRKSPALGPQRAELRDAATGVVGSPAFRSFLEFAVDAVRVEVAGARQPTAGVDPAEVAYGTALGALRAARPDLATDLPEEATVDGLRFAANGPVGTAVHDAARVAELFVPALILGLLTVAAATMAGGTVRRFLVVVAGAGLLTGAMAAVLSLSAIAAVSPADRPAARAVASVALGPLVRLSLFTAAASVGLAAALARLGRRWWAALAAVALVVVAVTAWLVMRGGGGEGDGEATCLGHRELCDRRFDEVVLAGTHNSMNTSAAGFKLPEHRLDLQQQLDAGIRALLIDTHMGRTADDGVVWTDVDLVGGDRGELVERFGEDRLDEAERARARSSQPAGPASLFLCHNLCELGATRYQDAFATVRNWLNGHPSEVLVLFVQDESSRDANIAAIRDAQLEALAMVHRDGEDWPTLRDVVRSGRRLFIVAEHEGGGAPWYHPAFPLYQDTAYDVPSRDAFTCDLNRGNADSPLFLLNHWVDRPIPSTRDAEDVNQPDVIEARARTCAEQRGRLPHIVAVNFSEEGSVVAAVDRLNGVG